MNETYYVYRIVNFINGKCYVGQTIDARKREGEHWRALERGDHHSTKLQRSYDKYGRSHFYFEILESQIPFDDVDKREIYWINYFDSKSNGFNCISVGIHPHVSIREQSQAVIWDNVEYTSIRAAVRSTKIPFNTLRRWIGKGYASLDDVDPRDKPTTWNGIEYQTLSQAAKLNNKSTQTLWAHLKKGYVCDDDLCERSYPKPISWNGIDYPSQQQAAIANNIPLSTMKKWIRLGFKGDNDVRVDGRGFCRQIVWEGVTYPSITQASDILNIPSDRLGKWIRKGYTCYDDVPRSGRRRVANDR